MQLTKGNLNKWMCGGPTLGWICLSHSYMHGANENTCDDSDICNWFSLTDFSVYKLHIIVKKHIRKILSQDEEECNYRANYCPCVLSYNKFQLYSCNLAIPSWLTWLLITQWSYRFSLMYKSVKCYLNMSAKILSTMIDQLLCFWITYLSRLSSKYLKSRVSPIRLASFIC